MQPSSKQLERTNKLQTRAVQVLCAADENYAKSLCVTLTTAASHLRVGHSLMVYLIDGGISEESWQKIRESIVDLPMEIEIIQPDISKVAEFSISHHVTHTAYFRLLAAEWLPAEVSKVIYLDSDLLVRDDLVQLWELEEKDYYCWAVPDIACPHVDAKVANYNLKKSCPYLATISPIRNYRELGIDGSAPYFNSGVMVMHLDKWREENVTERLLKCLDENGPFIWCWDQYALNVVFSGRWGQLPLKWNQGAHAFEFPSSDFAPICKEQFDEMIQNPSIVHYTTEWKPWDVYSAHPSDDLFFEMLDQTAWKGWRPAEQKFSIKRTWNNLMLFTIKSCVANYRRLSMVFQS